MINLARMKWFEVITFDNSETMFAIVIELTIESIEVRLILLKLGEIGQLKWDWKLVF